MRTSGDMPAWLDAALITTNAALIAACLIVALRNLPRPGRPKRDASDGGGG